MAQFCAAATGPTGRSAWSIIGPPLTDTLKCGVNPGLPGFSFTDDAGDWTGFEEAYCRALAAAVLGDADKVSFVPLTGKNRFPALVSGEVDILSRNTAWTFSRDTDLCFTFVGVKY